MGIGESISFSLALLNTFQNFYLCLKNYWNFYYDYRIYIQEQEKIISKLKEIAKLSFNEMDIFSEISLEARTIMFQLTDIVIEYFQHLFFSISSELTKLIFQAWMTRS